MLGTWDRCCLGPIDQIENYPVNTFRMQQRVIFLEQVSQLYFVLYASVLVLLDKRDRPLFWTRVNDVLPSWKASVMVYQYFLDGSLAL